MQPIRFIINKRINQQAGWRQQVNTASVIDKFNSMLATEFSFGNDPKAQAVYIKQKYLYVAVLSSVLSQEIKFREQKLINELNNHFREQVIKGIRYVG